MKLFIIGNGFDLAHRIESSYNDFYNYLKETYNVKDEQYYIENIAASYDDEISVDETLVGLIVNVICETTGEDWNDFEEALGLINYEGMFDQEVDDFKNPFEYSSINEQIGENIYKSFSKINDLFKEWMETISISRAIVKRNFQNTIDKDNDIFFTFNYTKTLEEKYNCKKVTHIHGTIDEDIKLGHGITLEHGDEPNLNINYLGAEDYIERVHEFLRKKTEDAIKYHEDFFNSINNSITEIYSIGFSFSDVDMIYFKKILGIIKSDEIIWYLSDYESIEDRENFKNRIQECNFEGEFNVFSLN